MLAATRSFLLCAAVLALPAIAASQTPLPLDPGWYHNGALIYEAKPGDNLEGLKIFWENSYVYEHPGKDPLYWYAHVVYRNSGSKTLTLWCTERNAPSLAKEHMSGTGNSGTVPAEETYCSRNSSLTFSIEPGAAYNYGWAIFHNVPWKGGTVSLEWGQYGRTPWVDPWPPPRFSGRPPPECPDELVTLGTCQPEIPSTPLTEEQLQALQNSALCANDILGHLGVALPFVGPVIMAVTYGNDIIAVIQDPHDPTKYLQLVLNTIPIPGLDCLKLMAASFLGSPYGPIPPGVPAPTPVPTPTPPSTARTSSAR